MNLTEINQFLPWFVIVFQFGGFTLIILRLIRVADDNTLAKSPTGVAPALPKEAGGASGEVVITKPCPPVVPPGQLEPVIAVDQGLVDFIKKQEGFEPKAKWDYKQWTNGYGTKAKSSTEVITEVEAEIRLRAEIAAADALVTKRFPALPKGLHQALIDLTYNAGSGWEEQSLGKAVAAQKIETIKADIGEYVHAGKPPVVLEVLVKRRATEVAMIDNPL